MLNVHISREHGLQMKCNKPESMFSLVSNASKYAFIKYIQQLQQENVQLIDCQVYTQHLESLGARMISRNEFIKLLHDLLETELLHKE